VGYHELPCFLDVIRKSVNFWNVSLKKPLEIPDRQLNFQRIFPHGGVILITEDFMVQEQDATLITLTWFADYVKSKPQGNWKLMLRPDVLNWLLRRFDSNKKKHQDR
jgi:chromo domain-containing protein 1